MGLLSHLEDVLYIGYRDSGKSLVDTLFASMQSAHPEVVSVAIGALASSLPVTYNTMTEPMCEQVGKMTLQILKEFVRIRSEGKTKVRRLEF
jgi:hypothetical protein